MIAVDTNVLVYAHVDGFPEHETAKAVLVGLAQGRRAWGIPAPCLGEFVRVTTHRRILAEPFTVAEAVRALEAVLASPTVHVLCPAGQHWAFLSEALVAGEARGNLAFDAVIAAICQEVGVTELVTEDRDFLRMEGLTIRRISEA